MTVHLVGAGPGDPDLLTLKAARLLARADVVIYDRLVASEVLAMAAPWAEMIDVGKDPNGRRTSQEEINALLIDRGSRHETVVRLKGGDPFVFGRGGEEALAAASAGIEIDVVPGITSAIAGPALAGIPVTHRHSSSAFTVVTAHEDPTKTDTLDWDALAQLGSTLVVLMGARRASQIRERLLIAGLDPATPVAIVTNASTAHQQSQRMSLELLGREPVDNPSIIVIGAVADFAAFGGSSADVPFLLDAAPTSLQTDAALPQAIRSAGDSAALVPLTGRWATTQPRNEADRKQPTDSPGTHSPDTHQRHPLT